MTYHVHSLKSILELDSTTPPTDGQGWFWNPDTGKYELDSRVLYIDDYIANAEYHNQNMVTDGANWIAIANKTTSDIAFPTEVGTSEFIYPILPPWQEANHTGQVRSGYIITFSEVGEVREVQIWPPEVVSTSHYSLVIIRDPNGSPVAQRFTLNNADLTAQAWNTVRIGATLHLPGQEVLAYLESQNFGSTTQVTGGWTYGGTDNNNPPATQAWNHNAQQSLLRIDKTDLDSTDRTSELMGIVSGSTVQFVETASPTNVLTYLVTADPVEGVSHVEYTVSLTVSTGTIPVSAVTTMTADIPVSQPTPFVFQSNKFLNFPDFANIESFLQYDDVTQPTVPDLGYGINFSFQQLEQSPDWDLIPIGDGGGGATSGGTAGIYSQRITGTTTGGLWQTLVTIPLPPSHFYTGDIAVRARRIDGTAYYFANWAAMAYNDPNVVTDQTPVNELGVTQLDFRLVAGVDEFDVQVRGRPLQEWSWTLNATYSET